MLIDVLIIGYVAHFALNNLTKCMCDGDVDVRHTFPLSDFAN